MFRFAGLNLYKVLDEGLKILADEGFQSQLGILPKFGHVQKDFGKGTFLDFMGFPEYGLIVIFSENTLVITFVRDLAVVGNDRFHLFFDKRTDVPGDPLFSSPERPPEAIPENGWFLARGPSQGINAQTGTALMRQVTLIGRRNQKFIRVEPGENIGQLPRDLPPFLPFQFFTPP